MLDRLQQGFWAAMAALCNELSSGVKEISVAQGERGKGPGRLEQGSLEERKEEGGGVEGRRGGGLMIDGTDFVRLNSTLEHDWQIRTRPCSSSKNSFTRALTGHNSGNSKSKSKR